MEHGVPVGDIHIKGVDLSQDLRREDEAQNGDLQRRRQFDMQLHLEPTGDIQQYDGQDAKERALVVMQHDLAHQRHEYQDTQRVKDDEGASVLPQLPGHGLAEVPLFPLLLLLRQFFQVAPSSDTSLFLLYQFFAEMQKLKIAARSSCFGRQVSQLTGRRTYPKISACPL